MESKQFSRVVPAKVVVDAEPLVRRGFSLWLCQHPQFLFCGEAAAAPQAQEQMPLARPDVAIVDPMIGEGEGWRLIPWLRREMPWVKVLGHSMHDTLPHALRVCAAGAHGFVPKGQATEQLLEALGHILCGQIYLPTALGEPCPQLSAPLPLG